MLTRSETSVFERLVGVAIDNLSRANAKAILALRFSQSERRKIRELSRRSNQGILSDSERQLLENYIRVGDLLTALHSRAEELLDLAGNRNGS